MLPSGADRLMNTATLHSPLHSSASPVMSLPHHTLSDSDYHTSSNIPTNLHTDIPASNMSETSTDDFSKTFSNLQPVSSSHNLSSSLEHCQLTANMSHYAHIQPEIHSNQMYRDHISHAVDLTLKSPGSSYQNKETLDRLLMLFTEYRDSYCNHVNV